MPELPASVRLSLWVTHAWACDSPLDEALVRALPDVDHVAGDLGRLRTWRELGEQALLVALPATGDLLGMPGASGVARGAAAASGECVYVPGIGGLLVPTVSTYGSKADVGTRVDWTAYDADPVPRHRVEALDVSSLERRLREQLLVATAAIDAAGGQPFAGVAGRELADAAMGGQWGLPSGLLGRAARVIALAGTVGRITDVALSTPDGALTATASARRAGLLRELQRTADRALADATNAACAVLAGWRPS